MDIKTIAERITQHANKKTNLYVVLTSLEIEIYKHALEESGYNCSYAAEALGVTRTRLLGRIHKLDLREWLNERRASEV